jgi:hypothetical protein
MKMLMLLVPSDCLEDVQELMDRHEIHAYTEVPYLPGSGKGGRKLGTRAFPGTSSMLLAVLPSEEAARLTAALREYAERAKCCNEMRMFGMEAEMLI